MGLRDFETKYLVLEGFNHINNPFFKQMVKDQAYSIDKDGGLCPHALSFYIVPLINAVNRSGTQEEKLLLFESMLDFMGYELIPSTKRGCKGKFETRVEQACRTSKNIRNRQNRDKDAGYEKIIHKIEDEKLDENKIILIDINEGILSQNLVGLVANEIQAKYNHPTLILTKKKDAETGKTLLLGSGRGCKYTEFNNFKDFLQESDYFFLSEGHQGAFGAGMLYDNKEAFINYSNEKLKDFNFSEVKPVDFIWKPYEVTKKDIESIASMNLQYGQEVEKPMIVIENLLIDENNMHLIGKNRDTIRIDLPNGIQIMLFHVDEDTYEDLLPNPGFSNKINILGYCDINEYYGKITAQIKVEEFELVAKNQLCF